ncbi:Spo12 family protein [Histoplasma capsulatum]|uniref:Spo12 family protein n=1 Tax=Ajellomyces capsulatus TaxID=5037 RepID=A0A8A1M0A8_AJECA|nr:Spo12 family protein [Histoplasma capsulatum]
MELNPTSPSKTTPLADRSTNILLSNTVPAGVAPPMTTGDCSADLKAATVMSMEYHRQVLKEKLENGKSAGKPQTLFAKAISKKPVEKKDES